VTGTGPVELRDAATVLILRDGPDGLEVFMLRRNLNSDFVGGAYVFPGGAVDPEDRHLNLEPVCEGRSDVDASRRLGIESGGLAFWVAAIRESFEEAGVLLAYDLDGMVDLDDARSAARWGHHRAQVDAGQLTMVDLCRLEGLRLAVDGMHYFSHWITPEGSPRRYDTRFFLAAAPTNQTPLHDDRETIANEWVRPADAIARVESGELTMMPPTVASLKAISRFSTAAEALDAAREITHVPEVLPRIISADGGMRIVLPGDPSYDGPQGVPDASIDWMGLATSGQVTGFGAEGSS
jgi:8-oxo-dGTP pyrophosphatase MutT (NUDIX family)